MNTKPESDGDLLYGVPAIANHLGMTHAQIYHLHKENRIPTYKMGSKVCASKTKLKEWSLAMAEGRAAAMGETSNVQP